MPLFIYLKNILLSVRDTFRYWQKNTKWINTRQSWLDEDLSNNVNNAKMGLNIVSRFVSK